MQAITLPALPGAACRRAGPAGTFGAGREYRPGPAIMRPDRAGGPAMRNQVMMSRRRSSAAPASRAAAA